MLSRWFGGDTALNDIASDVYGAIVARARQAVLYRDFGVPDTVSGRFEMVVAHMVVALERFEAGSERERRIGQRMFEVFCQDMDDSLREFGVSDMVMGKRMKKMARGFYGRDEAYMVALAESDDSVLAAALGRNLYPDRDQAADPRLAQALRDFRGQMQAMQTGMLEKPTAVLIQAMSGEGAS